MRYIIRNVVVLAILSVSCSLTQLSASAEDWPGFRGKSGDSTIRRSGTFEEGGQYALTVAWQHMIGSGYSSVSIVGGVAINLFSDADSDYAGAFRADTGEEIWRFRIAGRYPGRWGSKDGPISTSLIHAGRVYLLDPAGHFYCLDFKTGKLVWDADLPSTHSAVEPFYGFATSPLAWKNRVIVQVGGPEGSTVASFDAATGKTVWKSGAADVVNYQSPFLMGGGAKPVLMTLGDIKMSGLDPDSGRVYWTIEYGDGNDIGSKTSQIVRISDRRFFVNGTASGSTMYEFSGGDFTKAPTEVWKTRHIKNTYVVSVHHDGLIFGYNSRILACVDAATGELVWRSRSPGDGFPILVDGHLVIATKEGALSIAPASREGYKEIANLKVFDDLQWSTATFVDGKLYLRSIGSWARVDVAPARSLETVEEASAGRLPRSGFGRLVARLEGAENKEELIGEYLAQRESFPIIEGNSTVHFVYHGDGNDISLSSELLGDRYDRPLHRVPGTQLFYYSTALESNARLVYNFIKDFEEYFDDPRNPNKIEGLVTSGSVVAMPDWIEPTFLGEAPPERRGRIEELTIASQQLGETLQLKAYLPNGYDESQSYPVLYVHSATRAISDGKMINVLDHLLGSSVAPLIAVFIQDPGVNPSSGRVNSRKSYQDYVGVRREQYAAMMVEELFPMIEARYPVIASPDGRALVGINDGAHASFFTAVRHPGLVSKLGLLSPTFEPGYIPQNTALLKGPSEQPLQVFLEWGKYDNRSPREGWNAVDDGRAMAEALRSKGYTFVGGEVNEGGDWPSRRNRLDQLLETLFPR